VTTLLSAGSRIEESGIAVADMGLRRPTLDDVFLAVTAAGAVRPANGVVSTSLPSDQVDQPPGDARSRRRSPRRLVSYLAVAVVAAGLAVGLDSFLSRSSKTPRHAAHVSVSAAGHPRTVAAVAGMTQLHAVALGSTPAALTPDASGNLWVSLPEAGTVARVATADGRVQTFHVGGHPTAVGASFDRVWVAGSGLGPLASINVHTGAPLNSTQFRAAPTAIALDYDDNSACTLDATGLLTHIDSTGAVLGSAQLAHPATGVGCGEGWNWAVEPSPPALVRMGDYGGTRQFNGGPAPVAITFDQGVWDANRNGVVTVFDPRARSLGVTRQVAVAPELDGIYANEGDSSVWAISRQTKTLYRISNTAQPAVTGTVVFTTPPVALAAAGGSVWVATQDGSLTQIKY
jgi:hypothetical protein